MLSGDNVMSLSVCRCLDKITDFVLLQSGTSGASIPISFSVGSNSAHLTPGSGNPALRINGKTRHVTSYEIRDIHDGKSGRPYMGNLDFVSWYELIDESNLDKFSSKYPRISFPPYINDGGGAYLYFYCFSGSDIKGVFVYFI